MAASSRKKRGKAPTSSGQGSSTRMKLNDCLFCMPKSDVDKLHFPIPPDTLKASLCKQHEDKNLQNIIYGLSFVPTDGTPSSSRARITLGSSTKPQSMRIPDSPVLPMQASQVATPSFDQVVGQAAEIQEKMENAIKESGVTGIDATNFRSIISPIWALVDAYRASGEDGQGGISGEELKRKVQQSKRELSEFSEVVAREKKERMKLEATEATKREQDPDQVQDELGECPRPSELDGSNMARDLRLQDEEGSLG